jgi:hypothetical protein
MPKPVYKSNRRNILANIMTARRCGIMSAVRRYQSELVELRFAVAF